MGHARRPNEDSEDVPEGNRLRLPDAVFNGPRPQRARFSVINSASRWLRVSGVLLACSVFLFTSFICGWSLLSSTNANSASRTHGKFIPEERDCSTVQPGTEPVCSWTGTLEADDDEVFRDVVLDEPLDIDSKGAPVSVRWDETLGPEVVYIDTNPEERDIAVEIVLAWVGSSALCAYVVVKILRFRSRA